MSRCTSFLVRLTRCHPVIDKKISQDDSIIWHCISSSFSNVEIDNYLKPFEIASDCFNTLEL